MRQIVESHQGRVEAKNDPETKGGVATGVAAGIAVGRRLIGFGWLVWLVCLASYSEGSVKRLCGVLKTLLSNLWTVVCLGTPFYTALSAIWLIFDGIYGAIFAFDV